MVLPPTPPFLLKFTFWSYFTTQFSYHAHVWSDLNPNFKFFLISPRLKFQPLSNGPRIIGDFVLSACTMCFLRKHRAVSVQIKELYRICLFFT